MNTYLSQATKTRYFCSLLLTFIYSILPSQAQVKTSLSVTKISAGKNLQTNSPINGKEYLFAKDIFHYYIDPTTTKVTIQLRDNSANKKTWRRTGIFLVFNSNTNTINWAKTFDYQTDKLLQENQFMVQNSGERSYLIDTANGSILWESETSLKYIIPELNLGVGSRHNYSNSYQFYIDGIDLTHKNTAWSRSLIGGEKNRWKQDVTLSNGTKLLNTENGLHAIDLKTGGGWNYYALTSTSNQYLVAAATAGILFGAMGGIIVHPVVGGQANNISSNALIYNNRIHYAFKDSIICLANDGSTIWAKSFPSNFTSTSKLIAHNGTIYMLNYGISYGGENYTSMFGKPFIAAFNPNTGDRPYLTKINAATKKLTPIDVSVTNDTLVVLFAKKLGYYHAVNGELIKEQKMDSTLKEEYIKFMDENIYVHSPSDTTRFATLKTRFPGCTHVLLSNQKIEVTPLATKLTTYIDKDQYYTLLKETPNYVFIANSWQTKIINQQGKVVAELPLSNQATFTGNKAYDVNTNTLIEVDLSEFIEE